ncbi:hypothetical protein LVB77_09745 [Lysobacter sp. 5GHs7-4]|uniref:hypothetical protein n=1 Tax=Lysobacter sp. 5GHs7-4 TaxID=2904253 RepID=UPI001E29E1CD|nr:hypothetical protein [Lysobacter sp. 5GHs7-4]UHQ24928.1 hypothetical protein LVB77_09745 [Lysobacter sp. 5GHs7-4]
MHLNDTKSGYGMVSRANRRVVMLFFAAVSSVYAPEISRRKDAGYEAKMAAASP